MREVQVPEKRPAFRVCRSSSPRKTPGLSRVHECPKNARAFACARESDKSSGARALTPLLYPLTPPLYPPEQGRTLRVRVTDTRALIS